LSPETCRVKAIAKNKNAIVASCWTYFTYYNRSETLRDFSFRLQTTRIYCVVRALFLLWLLYYALPITRCRCQVSGA